jgi:Domain of unknown function (DUF4350)
VRLWIWIAGGVLLGALVWGLEQVVVSPLETGDVYPPFSSLRSDPLGTRALYESLSEMPGIAVDRLYKERTELGGPDDTLLVLGVDPVAWSALKSKQLDEYEKLVAHGGRLVIGFLPVRQPGSSPAEPAVEEKWGIRLRFRHPDDETESRNIPRETSLYFEAGPEWQVHDALAERSFGAGTVVLAANTFPLSNEGLREARNVDLIAALAGPTHRITFDENHFGVVESGSVAKLMRKYQLEGAIGILALVAGLFLWRSASSLLPPRREPVDDAIAGRDSLAGMTALLHRGIAERDLIDTCFAEWNRVEGKSTRAARVEEEIRNHAKDPAAAYRAASQVLSKKPT